MVIAALTAAMEAVIVYVGMVEDWQV